MIHTTLCQDQLGCYAYTDWLRDQGLDQEADYLMEIFIQGESGFSDGHVYTSSGNAHGDLFGFGNGSGHGDTISYGGGCGFGDGYEYHYGNTRGDNYGIISGNGYGDGSNYGNGFGDCRGGGGHFFYSGNVQDWL